MRTHTSIVGAGAHLETWMTCASLAHLGRPRLMGKPLSRNFSDFCVYKFLWEMKIFSYSKVCVTSNENDINHVIIIWIHLIHKPFWCIKILLSSALPSWSRHMDPSCLDQIRFPSPYGTTSSPFHRTVGWFRNPVNSPPSWGWCSEYPNYLDAFFVHPRWLYSRISSTSTKSLGKNTETRTRWLATHSHWTTWCFTMAWRTSYQLKKPQEQPDWCWRS